MLRMALHVSVCATLLLSRVAAAQEVHGHPAPEKLGTVVFPTTCMPAAIW